MSKNIFSAILVSAVFAMSSVPAWAVGSVAYRLEVADATAAGMGSAFVGEADSPAAVYYNPAGMTHVDGNALSIGASLIQPFGDVDRSSGTDQMQRHNFLVPSAF
ncbi:MAG: hypothetical protein GX606_03975, partial [Elusimicrobia bacterium]|nr:hypothetical protein [Elusimicrobiota bacterium]